MKTREICSFLPQINNSVTIRLGFSLLTIAIILSNWINIFLFYLDFIPHCFHKYHPYHFSIQ